MIFPTDRFYSLHTIPNGVLALFAFRRSEPDVACLTIWVTPIHGEPHIVVLKLAITIERDAPTTLGILAIDARSEKWISALGAEKVLFVICALPELGVVQSYEAFVHNGCFAMITTWRETLKKKKKTPIGR